MITPQGTFEPQKPQQLCTVEDARAFGKAYAEQTIALVPTMGALHAGHMALVDYAKTLASCVVVSIFVNPLQFGPHEDLERYPRTLEADLAACAAAGVDAVFCPTVEVLYPRSQEGLTLVTPPKSLVSAWCGASRPGHFAGVATVVLKLLNIIQPQVAVFGQKDAQQLAVIRSMVADLNLPVTIYAHPIVREVEGPLAGLAMSSRNRYLHSPQARDAAMVLSATLKEAVQGWSQKKVSPQAFLQQCFSLVREQLSLPAQELVSLEYLAAVDVRTFEEISVQNTSATDILLIMAAHVGPVRLIDNMAIGKMS